MSAHVSGVGPLVTDVIPTSRYRAADWSPTRRPAHVGSGGPVRVAGKKFLEDGRTFAVRGVTYGSFLPRRDGFPFPEEPVVRRDFVAMRASGLNTVRTYAAPPVDVVNAAEEAGLRLLIGVDYHDWRMNPASFRGRQVLDAGRRALDEAVAACQGRTGAVLGVVVGNEVPGDLVRLHGIERVQDVLSALVGHVHDADPSLLATYANYPTTEYLDVEGADFLAFNVFLERPDDLRRYTAHLHVLAGDRPVVVSELGLAEQVHGPDRQAEVLAAQLAEADAAGAAGACVFSWTDEWGVAGESVGGWGFGVTTEERAPKPALDAVADWARRDLRALRPEWPTVSVVVCAYNEERYIGDCLASLLAVDYPGLEVIVCDDGSTDRTREILSGFSFRVLSLEHGGLSAARNAGLEAAGGDIVAYLDADAMCDPDWPYHLALSLEDDVAATGGPNLPVPGAGLQERVVAASPGGPVEVLLADDRAEHVAGCNMAVRREVLTDLGGFDVAYTSAGDDVDLCWRLIDAGHEIGFAHAAQVWHHRRDTVRRYLRQQRNYGRSERMVAGRHAERFNRLGQARWAGFLYSSPRMRWPLLRPLLYHGHFGSAPYQRVVDRPADTAMQVGGAVLPLSAPVALAGGVASVWEPWALTVPALMLALVTAYAVLAAVAIRPGRAEPSPARVRCLAGVLHAVQPFVRTWGRLRGRPLPQRVTPRQPWTGDRPAWLVSLQRELARGWRRVTPGGPTDGWDLAVTAGPCARYSITTAVVWGWEPVWRGRLLPRRRYVAALAAASLLPLAGGWLVLVPVGMLAAAAAEATVLRRTVGRVVRLTVAGAAVERADEP
jgi:glycosyltransferase involved in cell wall biosynthesis